MNLRCFHRTVYRYSISAIESHNEVRLQPVTDSHQTCKKFTLTTSPRTKVFAFEEIGGTVHYFTIRPAHKQLEITAEAEIETNLTNPFDGLNLVIPDIDYYQLDSVRQEFAEYLIPSTYVSMGEETYELAMDAKLNSNGVSVQFLLSLNQALYHLLDYDPDVTHVHSTVNEVIELGGGVCQDFAHIMIACCRSVGIPARYVSGYLYSSSGSGIRGADAMHAWVEVPVPGGRWLALDPTNNLLANEHHIRVHCGRDYADITPLKGLYMGSRAEAMDVDIRVEEIEPAETVSQGIA